MKINMQENTKNRIKLTPSVDSGWSWIVCIVAFVIHSLIIGFSYSIGVYYVEFLSVFNESKGTTGLISGLYVGTCNVIGKNITF